jgi:Na+/melibiose symporter-like transporter
MLYSYIYTVHANRQLFFIAYFIELKECANEVNEISAQCVNCGCPISLPTDRRVKGKVRYFETSKLILTLVTLVIFVISGSSRMCTVEPIQGI